MFKWISCDDCNFFEGHSEGGSLIVGHESCLFSAFTGDMLIALVCET